VLALAHYRARMDTITTSHEQFESEAARIESFARAIDAIRREVENDLGEKDAAHIQRIGSLSRNLEWAGRTLLYFSFEPVTFGLGTGALFIHKSLELMEIGHMALHGAYDRLAVDRRYQNDFFRWKAPIDEKSWRVGHNVRHHQYTNIENRDPDIDFGGLRLSPRVAYRRAHALQPFTNLVTWLGFASAINLHVTGLLDLYLGRGQPEVLPDRTPETLRAAHRTFLSKMARYYGREYVFFPLLAGPFFWKVLLGNVLSEIGRDVVAGAVIYCGHVGAKDYPAGTRAGGRARWYVMQAEAARNIEVPTAASILFGGLDYQIEHHLFPRLPPNRLREIAPRVRAVCKAHDVRYLSKGAAATLREVMGELRQLSSRGAKPSRGSAVTSPEVLSRRNITKRSSRGLA
jgi:NADPH-dependent stearoyl-CoA 9-desaturase